MRCSCFPLQLSKWKKVNPIVEPFVILFVGIGCSGKTSVLNRLVTDSVLKTFPTWGFACTDFRCNLKLLDTKLQRKNEKIELKLYDVGGGQKIRGIWPNYYAEAHALVFVVDACQQDTLEESSAELKKLLSDHRIAGKPILILFNKVDCLKPEIRNLSLLCSSMDALPGALSREEYESATFISEGNIRVQMSSTLIKKSSTEVSNSNEISSLDEGFLWLIQEIKKQVIFCELQARIDKDVSIQQIEYQEAREDQRKRVAAQQTWDQRPVWGGIAHSEVDMRQRSSTTIGSYESYSAKLLNNPSTTCASSIHSRAAGGSIADKEKRMRDLMAVPLKPLLAPASQPNQGDEVLPPLRVI